MSTRTHHVNLPVPDGAASDVAAFYVDVLGVEIAPRPESRRPGVWLAVGDGTQVHLSEGPGTPHPDQHVAFVVDDFEGVRERAAAAGAPWTSRGEGRGVFRDPAGNLVEVFAAGTEPG